MGDGLQGEFGLLPEGANQFRSALHRLQATAREVADLGQVSRAQVGDLVLLQVGPDRFDRIQFGGVGRQEGNRDPAVLLFEPLPHAPTLVRADAVPNDQQLVPDLALESAQEFDDLFASDCTVDEAEVEAPPGEPGDGRHLLPGEALLDDRGMPTQPPSASHRALLGQSRLVDEDYRPSLTCGVFFSAGQVLRFQLAMATSSRCSARFSGFCGEKPRLRNSSQQPELLYVTPNSRLTSTRPRFTVHNSVGKPARSAPLSRAALSVAHWRASSHRGRPSAFALSFPTAPWTASNWCAQRLTDCRDTSSRRATSACGTLRLSRRAPSMRRASIASKSRFVAMRHLRQKTCRNNARA